MKTIVSIGLRAKTARAIAVVVAAPSDSPVAVRRAELILASSALPATFEPYHEVMELPWQRATVAVQKAASAIEVIATEALRGLVRQARSDGLIVCGVGIVGAPDRNLEAIGSPHIRAHAAEGVLFRRVLEHAAKTNRLSSRTFSERAFEDLAAAELGLTAAVLRSRVAELGRALGRPWRADEKMAATAAWLALLANDQR